MEMLFRTEGDIRIIDVLDARIDAPNALEFKETFRTMTLNAPARVILDLTKVTFIDSSGLGAIVAAMKHLAPERQLHLAGLTGPVEKVFQLTRMDSIFRIFPTLDDALVAQGV
ncbi:MAG: STAS domain-containing protein [Sulfitobacter sp.]